MHFSRSGNLQWIIPLLLLTACFAVLSAVSHEALLAGAGILLFLLFVFLALDEGWIKAVLPLFLIFILFQDTLSVNSSMYIPGLSTLINYLDEAFLLVCLSALALNILSGKKVRGAPVFLALCSLVFLGALSGYLNQVPVLISLQGAFLLLKGLLYLFVIMNISFTQHDLKRYVKWVQNVSLVIVLFAGVEIVLGEKYRTFLHIDYEDAVQRGHINSLVSLFVHPGLYGWFMVYAGIFALAAFVVMKEKRYLLTTLLFFCFALLSFRFKVMLGILAIFLVLYLMRGVKKSLSHLLPLLLLSAAGFLIAGQYAIDLTTSTVDSYITADIQDSARKALYVVAYEIGVENFPVGEGFGRYGGFISKENYSPVYHEYGIDTIYGLTEDFPSFMTDTYWPNIAGELGFSGMAIVLGLYVYLSIKLLRQYAAAPTAIQKIFVLFAGLVMIQALIESLGEPIFNSAPQNVFIFTTVGIAFSILNRASARSPDNEIS